MCGIFGFSDYGHKISNCQANKLVEALVIESAVRGTDATGIAYNINNRLEIYKAPKSAYQMHFNLPKNTSAVIGHTRHSTQGSSKKRYNNHPFRGRLQNGEIFALAHNGIIDNDVDLRKKHRLPNTKIETDSYVAVQLLERNQELSFKTLKTMAEDITGSFAFAILDDHNNTYLIKGYNPLSILHFTELKLYAYASTDEILWRALSASLLPDLKSGRYEEVHIDHGKMLKITPQGKVSSGEFEYLPDCFLYNWWDYGCSGAKKEARDTDYFAELKSMAGAFGCLPEDIDEMMHYGYTADEIEELLYCEGSGKF